MNVTALQLRQHIENRVAELQNYASKADSKPTYIEKQNALIQDLTSIYNQIERIEYLTFGQILNQK